MKNTLEFSSGDTMYCIPFERITALKFRNGTIMVETMGDNDALAIPDSFTGDLFHAAKTQLRNYYTDKQAHWMEAIQYGIIMASQQGAFNHE